MLIDFSNIQVQDKTFTRKGSTKEQMYHGFKFRKVVKEKNGEIEVTGKFFISDKVFTDLDLNNNCLMYFVSDGKVCLIVSNDESLDGTFLKSRKITTDGVVGVAKKGKLFKNEFLEADLVKAGIIDPSLENKNQYFTVEAVTELQNAPNYIVSVQTFVADITSDDESDEDEDEGTDVEEVDYEL